ncbi:MAG: hypothetical protein WCP19_03635 [Chloroflexota bacterium]
MNFINFLFGSKEKFTPTYYDSEEYYKQNTSQLENTKVNNFNPSEQPSTPYLTGYNNPYSTYETGDYYPINNNQKLNQTQQEWVKENSIYDNKLINGIPINDYYDTYTKDVLSKGNWFLNKDMPQDTKQYVVDNNYDTGVQQRMEIFTGLRQERDRGDLGKPNRTETLNFFTPQEKTVGYGYQYGNSSSGPGLALTRQKEIEEMKSTFKFKTNEHPIEQIQVGPGLAISTDIPAAGGFQQYTRIVPDNISDYAANQLPGMVAGGKWMNNAPTSQQPVMKNRPNGYYTLCQYGPGPMRSTMTAETMRPDYGVVLKNQNRTLINYGFGTPLTNLDDYLVTN